MNQMIQMSRMRQMKAPRFAFISALLTFLLFPYSPVGRSADQPGGLPETSHDLEVLRFESCPSLIAEYHGLPVSSSESSEMLPTREQEGIREVVPDKYMARYQQWKKEFLSTQTGRDQWAFYKDKANFTLTVVVSRDNPEGGTTGNYRWNDAGQLVAATITLGCRLDAGFPNPIYFPVMNSLLPTETSHQIAGETLAATKMAHEFGHVNRTVRTNSVLYQLQSQLMPRYNEIFLSNGRNPKDQRLLELEGKMGGTPVEIWEDREYWGETNAMLYIRDRFAEDGFRCLLFTRIKRSVDLYAKSYEERFLNVAQSTSSNNHCGW